MQLEEYMRRLQRQLALQHQDASNQGDRSGALIIQRISTAITRVNEIAAAQAEATTDPAIAAEAKDADLGAAAVDAASRKGK